MSTMPKESVSPGVTLGRMVTAYYTPQVLYAACRLRIPDVLQDEALTYQDLAQQTAGDPPSVRRLVRALVSIGVLAEDADGRVRNTELGKYLRTDVPGSRRNWVLFHGGLGYRLFGELVHSVQTGAASFDQVFGAPFFTYMADHRDDAAIWDAAMDETLPEWVTPFLRMCDLSGVSSVVDMGAGHGRLLSLILRAYPEMRGTAFDLPHVVEGAGEVLEAAGVSDRCSVVRGNLFEDDVPPGADAYVLSRVLFNWDDERAARLLANARRAMQSGARLLVIDVVTPEGPAPAGSALLDLFLLVGLGARQRTSAEFARLFQAAGFAPPSVQKLPPPSQFSVLESIAI